MEQEKIKETITAYRESIKLFQAAINKLQSECSHHQTFEKVFSSKVGDIYSSTICSDCDKFIKFNKQ
jgi:hypothetical protein